MIVDSTGMPANKIVESDKTCFRSKIESTFNLLA